MTTPMPIPDDLPRELLAAYADGELDAEGRAAVERFLADHPDALDDLRVQRAFSPANLPLWSRVEPPEPSEAVWTTVRDEIEVQLVPAVIAPSRWRVAKWALAGLATAGVAAAVAWVAFGPVAPQPRTGGPNFEARGQGSEVAPHPREVAALAPAPRSGDPLDGFAVLPMATDDDVILHRVPDFRAGWLPVGLHPVSGVLALATEEEILLTEVAPNAAMITAPGDAPIIFAAPKAR